MSKVLSSEIVVAIPESFGLELPEGKEDPQVVGKVRVVEGDTVGREQWLYMQLKGGAAAITMKQLRALGWLGTDLTNLDDGVDANGNRVGFGTVKARLSKTAGTAYKDKDGNTKQGKDQYTIWAIQDRPTMRDEDKAKFAAQFAQYAALAAGVAKVKVSDTNRAPAELPEARETETASKPESDLNSFFGG